MTAEPQKDEVRKARTRKDEPADQNAVPEDVREQLRLQWPGHDWERR